MDEKGDLTHDYSGAIIASNKTQKKGHDWI
jgi:hypothetical protein